MALQPLTLLRNAIERSGLSARQYAKRVLLRDERTVRRWLAGDPMPAVVVEFLRGEESNARKARKPAAV